METISEKEEKLADILHQSGFDRGTAKTLIYMLDKKTACTVDIERAMDLRQPEVSVGTKELRRLGILSMKDIPKKRRGKGRPVHQYTLEKSVSEVKDFLIKGMQKKIGKIEKNIEALKTLMGD